MSSPQIGLTQLSQKMKIEGSNAIVTGGSSGLGKATVEWLAQRGANVLI
jgi:NAD(P)-dependent dehydrogenase (short-subunit alcohol dehydrogenase family)